MALDLAAIRIDGIYPQKQAGYFMRRVKIPGAVLSASQADAIAEIADRLAGGNVHLTSRASIEFHWLTEENLDPVTRMLTAAGLTSRGACGGAVRGVVCGPPASGETSVHRLLARAIHGQCTANPRFEGLPKKFKIGVFGGTTAGRHLIQDASLVLAETAEGEAAWDLWGAGGLGREPQPAFLLTERLPTERVIPFLEGMVRVYRERTPLGKRLKHLVREIGQEEFRSLVTKEAAQLPDVPVEGIGAGGDAEERGATIEAGIFAGDLAAAALRSLAEFARRFAGGSLVLTAEQNILFRIGQSEVAAARAALAAAGFDGKGRDERVVFRVCPGSHECRMGLAPTRDLARGVIAAMGERGLAFTWAVSGCHNSCSQPQLADAGIISARLERGEADARVPLFDLYRRSEESIFGTPVRTGLSQEELLRAVEDLG